MVYADNDARKDLLLGQGSGTVQIYMNVGTDEAPAFDEGTRLKVGEPGSKADIDVGARATPSPVDWNNDGRRDLVAGAWDGKIRVFINEGADSLPDYRAERIVQEGGSDLVVPTLRSSPVVLDLDDDGKKDILAGNTEGQLLLYTNTGADDAPLFSGYSPVESDSAAIDLSGLPRSRPFVCDWNGDRLPDVLVGAGDGLVHLYRGVSLLTAAEGGANPPPAGWSLAVGPNPSASGAIVRFHAGEDGPVRIDIHDVRGKKVRALTESRRPAGSHSTVWDGRDDHGRKVSAGVYFVRLRSAGRVLTAKAVVVR